MPRTRHDRIAYIPDRRYSRASEGCGFAGMTLDVLPWLDAFDVGEIDEDGDFSPVENPARYSPEETTFVLRNRFWRT